MPVPHGLYDYPQLSLPTVLMEAKVKSDDGEGEQ